MNDNFEFLFQYFEKENISIDKSEFLFQIQSHPEYPSLLSITDTLTFFNIRNNAIKVKSDEIELLPNNFVAYLRQIEAESTMSFITKRNEDLYYINDKIYKKLSINELRKRWLDTVILIEKSEELIIDTTKRTYPWLFIICIVVFLVFFNYIESKYVLKLFNIFPIIGILFSIVALKDVFGAKSALISKFCNISVSTSCESVINSEKWKLFKFLNFSDLSIVFFAMQFVSAVTFIALKRENEFFTIQFFLLLSSLPLTLASIYYQKFVVKKWCPICLAIISILILEIIFIYFFIEKGKVISLFSILLLSNISAFLALFWGQLKKILLEKKELKEFQMKGNRFMRNYSIFKNSLISKSKIDLPNTPISIGNETAKIKITIITSPFCGFCSEADKVINRIIDLNPELLSVNIIFNVDISSQSHEIKLYYRTLLSVYFEKGKEEFRKVLTNWFEERNLNNWLKKNSTNFNSMKIDEIYSKLNVWCETSQYNFTPVLFINGYEYPKAYEIKNLEFFIVELIDDQVI